MRTLTGILILVSISSMLFAEEHPSIHQIEYQQYRSLGKTTSLFDPSGKDIIPLQADKASELSAVIFGYLPDWEYGNRGNLQYDLLTHIAAFDFAVSESGSISYPSYWPWTDVINTAHENGVKVVMTAVNFNATQINTIMTGTEAKNAFFTNCRNIINLYQLDGVNVDFESLNSADRGSLLNGFMADLTEYIHQEVPGAEVSFAGPAVNWGGWDLYGLAESCDYIFIMGYSFWGSWSSTSGPCAPLTGGSINITNTVLTQYGSVTSAMPEKLILGVPYYGNRWRTETSAARSNALEYIGSVRYRTAQPEADSYGYLWEQSSQTPWYRYQTGSDWYQAWFDDDTSLGLKYDLAENNNLMGVGMWALCYDGSRPELWDELRRRYAPGAISPPQQPAAPSACQAEADDQLVVTFTEDEEATGYWIYVGENPDPLQDSVFVSGSPATLSDLNPGTLYYLRIRGVNEGGLGQVSGLLTATTSSSPARVLIVNGFDRTSGTINTFDYMKHHSFAFNQIGYTIASAENEAVTQGTVQLGSYDIVDWYLGDESTTDVTFSPGEQARIATYLENGGRLLVSGSEIGWDLVEKGDTDDIAFYNNYLKASYVADAPLDESGTHYDVEGVDGTIGADIPDFTFDDGSHGTFDVDWPDAILPVEGAELFLKFTGVNEENGGCGIVYNGPFGSGSVDGALIYLSIPIETIFTDTSRELLLSVIMHYFEEVSDISGSESPVVSKFRLFQNYPNPFNSQTAIGYQLLGMGNVELDIFNTLGQKIHTIDAGMQQAGYHTLYWDAEQFPSGIYIYQLTVKSQELNADNQSPAAITQSRRMILVK